MKRSIVIPRELLLVEIERRCGVDGDCNARTRVVLTKDDARAYCGFTCERCERWNEDVLSERDVPEWWEELAVTGLAALREPRTPPAPEEPDEFITRLSDHYQAEIKSRMLDIDESED